MQDDDTAIDGGQAAAATAIRQPAVQAMVLALRGMGEVCEMNAAAARLLLQAQARAATAFGWPDLTDRLDEGEGSARRWFAATADQLSQATQRASHAVEVWRTGFEALTAGQTDAVANGPQRAAEAASVASASELSGATEATAAITAATIGATADPATGEPAAEPVSGLDDAPPQPAVTSPATADAADGDDPTPSVAGDSGKALQQESDKATDA